ncbi:ORF6N domain-containing protein [Candidatus Peregrinibacteria bacterium]|nr:ORF6N domain-containing protein [Candidatus Peregrinibacteria bacterium]
MQKNEPKSIIPIERIECSIYIIRGQKVMLDRDLAILYGIDTRALVQAVKRNLERFPADFMFQLTRSEMVNLMSQIVISSWGGHRKPPYAFTEQGVAMLSSVLRSPQAVKVNIEIMRAFIKLRQVFASHKELAKELKEVKEFVLKNSNQTSREFRRVWQAIEKLSDKPKGQRQIGFDLD